MEVAGRGFPRLLCRLFVCCAASQPYRRFRVCSASFTDSAASADAVCLRGGAGRCAIVCFFIGQYLGPGQAPTIG